MKKVISLLMAFVLVLSSIGGTFASKEVSTSVEDESAGLSGEVQFSFSGSLSKDGWYTESGIAIVEFPSELGAVDPSVQITETLGGVFAFPVEPRDDGSYVCVSDCLTDGIYNFYASYKDSDGNNYTDTHVIHVDTTPVNCANVVVGGVKESNGVWYAGEYYTISGFSDTTSGIRYIETYNSEGLAESYTEGFVIKVYEDTEYLKMCDIAGNEEIVPIEDLLSEDCGEVIFDSELPSLYVSMDAEGMYDKEGFSCYNGGVTVTVSAEDSNLSNVTVSVNNEEFDDVFAEGSSVNKSYSFSDNKFYEVVVTVTDLSGNVVSETVKFIIDTTAPDKGSLMCTGTWQEVSGVVYSTGIDILGSASDSLSGISTVEVLCGSEVVSTSLPYTISQSGEYYVRVTDNVGNYSLFSLSDILGSDSSTLVLDEGSPVVSIMPISQASVNSMGYWYSEEPSFMITASDDSIKSVLVKTTIDGVDEVLYSGDASLVEHIIQSVGASGKRCVLVVSAEDIFGNVSSKEFSFTVDGDCPYVSSADAPKPNSVKGDVVYFGTAFDLVLKANDDGFGEIIYYLDGVKSFDGIFKGVGEGEHFVQVEDGLGNKSDAIPLSDLLGWSSNTVKIVSAGSIISAPAYNGSWVASLPYYPITISDEVGIDRYAISVDGVVVMSGSYELVDLTTCNTGLRLSAHITTDGRHSIEVSVTSNAGIVSSYTDSICLDTAAPVIEGFDFKGAKHSDGLSVNGSEEYSFFFDNEGEVTIRAVDGENTSGIYSICYRFEGSEWVECVLNGNTSINVPIPADFKGKIEAYAVDTVGNKGSVEYPDLVVSEVESAHTKSSYIDILLPSTPYVDINGLPLYNGDINVEIIAGCPISGVRQLGWGIPNVSEYTEDFTTDLYEKNLSVKVSHIVPVSVSGNGVKFSSCFTDGVGHTSEYVKMFSIDKTAPVVTIEYDTTNSSGHYATNRVAYISVVDDNFNPEQFVLSGAYGELGEWVCNGSEWSNSITFSEEGIYSFTIECSDMAGNKYEGYSSEEFIIDKSAPVITRVDGCKETANGWYSYAPELLYNIEDEYFDSYVVHVNGSEVDQGRSTEVAVDTGNYLNQGVEVKITAKDLAGNATEVVYCFAHDNTAPSNIKVDCVSPSFEKGGKVYFNSPIEVVISSEDGNGYGHIAYKLNDAVSEFGKFTIDADGVYTVTAYDGLGNSTKVPLEELCGWSGSEVVINSVKPVVECSKYNGAWVPAITPYSFKASSEVGINYVTVVVNGVTVVDEAYSDTATKGINLDANILDAPVNDDLSYVISITVVDNSGLSTVVNDTVYLDTAVPNMGTLSVSGEWEVHDGLVYLNSPVTISGMPADLESGLADARVYKDGQYAGSLPYNIHESGEYYVVAMDKVGNKCTFMFADIAGIESSSIVWDDTIPVVYFDGENSDNYEYFDGENYWYKKNPVIYIGMSDDNLADISVSVTIDGVDTIVVDKIIEDGVYAIDTSYAKGTSFKVVATARDKSGSVVTDYYEFMVDTQEPNTGSLSAIANPSKVEGNSFVYTKGYFHISGSPSDVGSGVKEVFIIKDEVSIKCGNTIDLVIDSESLSGNYTIRVIDNVGNMTEIPVSALLGSEYSDLVVDHTVPVVSRVDSNKETKFGWYNYAPVLSYTVYDENIRSYTVVINGDTVKSGQSSEEFTLDMSEYRNMRVSLEISVTDWAGNITNYSYSYSHDDTPPSNLKISLGTPSAFKDSFVYYNNAIDVTLLSSDSGYEDITYYVNGNNVGDKLSITESGEYYLEVVDGLGNTTGRIRFAELLGWSGNFIIIDSKNPTISAVGYNGSWIKGDGRYNISVSDDTGLNNVVVKINGVTVISDNITDTDCINKGYSVNTGMGTINDDGSYNVSVQVVDNSGLACEWHDTVYVDNTAPVVDDFNIINAVMSMDTKSGYGYFFNGSGSIEITCSDAYPSCGIGSIWTRFEGHDWVEHKLYGASSVTVSVPAEFKGSFEAYAVDNVGNTGAVLSPVKLVSETEASYHNNHKIDVVLPETPYLDINGLPLYNSDICANVSIMCGWSGLKVYEWSVMDLNTVSSFTGGQTDENLTVKYDDVLNLQGNSNGLGLSVCVTDNAGHKFFSETAFSIDKDVPVISVSYDNTEESGYYNYTRVATISILERNFDPSAVTIDGSVGKLGTWKRENGVWVNTMTFSDDGDYQFTVNCTDLAGNKAAQYASDGFTIDKTAPVLSVSWSEGSADNGMYYNSSRVAVISVVEKNFNSEMVVVETTGTAGAWVSDGNNHSLRVVFDTDGEHSMLISAKDRAGNPLAEGYESELFIIDLTYPEVLVERISEGVSYKSDLEFVVTVKDAYVNPSTKVTLVGKNHEEYEVTGRFMDGYAVFSYGDFPEIAKVDDVYTLKVVAVDNAGNIVEKAVCFSVNRFGSSYEFDALSLLNNYVGSVDDVVIYEVNVDKLDLSKVDVIVHKDGKPVQLKPDWVSVSEEDTGTKYLYTYFISKDAFFEDGKYNISIMSESFDGTKYTSASEQYVFVVDKTPPVVIISGVESGKIYNEYERIVALDIRDFSGIAHFTVKVDGVEVSDISSADGLYSFVVSEKDSAQSIVVEVVDFAGNTSTSEVTGVLITSNILLYLINQNWVKVILASALLVILVLIITLIVTRRKERSEENASVIASGEVYRSSTGGSSSGSSQAETTETPVSSFESIEVPAGYTDVSSDSVSTGVLDESETSAM